MLRLLASCCVPPLLAFVLLPGCSDDPAPAPSGSAGRGGTSATGGSHSSAGEASSPLLPTQGGVGSGGDVAATSGGAGEANVGGEPTTGGAAYGGAEPGVGGAGGGGDDGDGSVPLSGFGTVSGACGELTAEVLGSLNPSVLRSHIDFGSEALMPSALSADAQKLYGDGTGGGSSQASEAISFEVLRRCELATLLKVEDQVLYETDGRKIDYLAKVNDTTLGVAVVRAFVFPHDAEYTQANATNVLTNKLEDMQIAAENVQSADAWSKPLLSVIAYGDAHADAIEAAFGELSPAVKEDTLLWITVTDGEDGFIY